MITNKSDERPMAAVAAIVARANELLSPALALSIANVYGDDAEQCRVAVALPSEDAKGRSALEEAVGDWKRHDRGGVCQLVPLGIEHMELTVTRPSGAG